MSDQKHPLQVELGEYTVIQNHDGKLLAMRYGEPWRNCVGDGLIFALAYEVHRLRNQESTPPPVQWIKANERLPTAKDADYDGKVWVALDGKVCRTCWENVGLSGDTWTPTNLKKPEPPKV